MTDSFRFLGYGRGPLGDGNFQSGGSLSLSSDANAGRQHTGSLLPALLQSPHLRTYGSIVWQYRFAAGRVMSNSVR
jgi:hypothetical protein